MSMPGIAGMLELIGGTMLVLGLFTRPVAFLSGEMAAAYFTAHFPNGFWPLTNMGEPAVLYCFAWLYFAFAGGARGAWTTRSPRAEGRRRKLT